MAFRPSADTGGTASRTTQGVFTIAGQFIRIDERTEPRMVIGVIARNPMGRRAFTLAAVIADAGALAHARADLRPGDTVEVEVAQCLHPATTHRVVSWRKV